MATVYVIYAEDDTPFVKQRMLRRLPSNGYYSWLARHHITAANRDDETVAQAMEQCPAILIVLSRAILNSPPILKEIDIALRGRRMLVVVQIAGLNEKETALLPARLLALPKVDLTVEEEAE